jgi:N-terminal acetyltransferase B complex non-catalytic subunit
VKWFEIMDVRIGLTRTDNITEETILLDKTDYGSLPNLESSHGPPIYEYLRLGPGLSVS